MSIVQTEGFELITSNADLRARNWPFAEGVLAATASKWGGQAWDLGNNSGTVLSYDMGTTLDNPYFGVSFWRYFENEPSAGTYVIAHADVDSQGTLPPSTNSHASLFLGAGGLLQVKGGHGAVLQELENAIVAGVWMHFEWRVFIDNSVGTVELWIDGFKVTDLTGVDTRDSGAVGSLYFNGNVDAVNSMVDDIVVSMDPSSPVGLVGVHRIHTLLADGEGTNTAWTGTSADVDDPIGASDGDSTFASSSTLNQKQDYTFADLTESPATIFAVQVTTEARKDDAGVMGITPFIISNAVTDNGTEFGASEAYQTKKDLFELNPDGAAAWTEATVNAVTAGHEITTV